MIENLAEFSGLIEKCDTVEEILRREYIRLSLMLDLLGLNLREHFPAYYQFQDIFDHPVPFTEYINEFFDILVDFFPMHTKMKIGPLSVGPSDAEQEAALESLRESLSRPQKLQNVTFVFLSPRDFAFAVSNQFLSLFSACEVGIELKNFGPGDELFLFQGLENETPVVDLFIPDSVFSLIDPLSDFFAGFDRFEYPKVTSPNILLIGTHYSEHKFLSDR